MVNESFFSSLHHELVTRSSRSITSLLGVANAPLRSFLVNTLKKPGALLADPVFEPTFGWMESKATMGELPDRLVHPRLLKALANPPKELFKEYEFPKLRHPFIHQMEAWEILSNPNPQSLVVTSGTGSGKTECFLVPILNSLAHQVDEENAALEGVRALFIYPLNALIGSQKNRLDAWTDGFDGDIRYCLYTGNLNEVTKSSERKFKGEVLDRKSLRASAPPLLVTNATMLEYMLVRKEDTPILQQSQGKLQWIVLDEAHTYVGSQAAEMALLLRRVMLAFGVKPENVRFVATSATFGSDVETTNKLKSYLAKMAGVSNEQVHVVHGRRHVPVLPAVRQVENCSVNELLATDPEQECSETRFQKLLASPVAQALRAEFIREDGTCQPKTLSELGRRVGIDDPKAVLRWLDLLTGTRNKDDLPFLPVRCHLFHNVLSCLSACVNPLCSEKHGLSEEGGTWPFGMVYFDDRTRCKCGAPVLPITQCAECHTPALLGSELPDHRLGQKDLGDEDEFALDQDMPEMDEDTDTPSGKSSELLVLNQPWPGCPIDKVWLDIDSSKLLTKPSPDKESVELSLLHLSDGEQKCPCCNAGYKYRKMAVGTPFTLSTVISTLLEFCPEDAEQPSTKPARGRKMISFTDSRQGTARIAVKLQQDSERAKVRGLIYHRLLDNKTESSLSPQDKTDLDELLLEKSRGSLRPRDQNYLDSLLAKQGSDAPAPISWEKLKNFLAGDQTIGQSMLDYYHRYAPNELPKEAGAGRLAEIFLYREFARRPKKQNSLESMGFVAVHYPQLDNIQSVPSNWPRDLASWKSYLKVLLDFYIRENSFIDVPPGYLSLIGMKLRPKWLRAPSSTEQNTSRIKKWPLFNPQSGVQSRPIALLQKAFGWEDESYRDRVDLVMGEAWDALVKDAKLLRPSGDGFNLRFEDIQFCLIPRAGICPITRRFLDTTFEKLSPYTFVGKRSHRLEIEVIDMPVYPHAFGEGVDAIPKARAWLDADGKVAVLRQEGLWSDLHDRAVEGGVYYRAAEHSAQQPQHRLQGFENEFKSGRLNLMSCSTTMEMGVDIGGITVVAMNNVPPNPANYLQRAGRAGRRRESRAIAATVCKNTPHDQAVFANPKWAFEKKITMPDVSLQSPDLVLRHINAHLLSNWMKAVMKAEELRRTTCGAFFLSDTEWSLAKRFITWCEHGQKHLDSDPALVQQIRSLTYHTPFDGYPETSLIQLCAKAMHYVESEWLNVYEGVQQQMAAFDGGKNNPAQKAMELQKSRVEGEYLLSELATRRFLPGYGFPTDIVCFDNHCIATLKQGGGDEREDNRMRSRSLASRDRATALREYAPGAELVMNGLVYRSGGVTLNWHVPATEEKMREAQLFKFAWRCGACGASDSVIGCSPDICSSCGNDIKLENCMQYLVPSGFAVDFFGDPPHNDVSSPTYIPVKQPWLSVDEKWATLANPNLGLFRTTTSAHLFHYTGGLGDQGFAICLECGKAEPMLGLPDHNAPSNEEYLPKIFRKGESHLRLRGGKGADGKSICAGSDNAWKIKKNVYLGHDATTDALEIILRDPDSEGWVRDDVVAFSLSVAIRSVLAQELGIIEEELGCATREVLHEGLGARAIQIFDVRSGGYSSLARTRLQERSFWESVRHKLMCGHDCTSVCQQCLLSFDTRFSADRLNRHAALALLTDEWIVRYELPADMQAFGSDSSADAEEIIYAIERQLVSGGAKSIRLYLQGNAAEWDLSSAHTLTNFVRKILARECQVELVAQKSSLASMSLSDRYKLAGMVEFGANYVEIDALQMLTPNGFLLVAGCDGNNPRAWGVEPRFAMFPTKNWGGHQDGALLIAGSYAHESHSFIDIEAIRPKTGDVCICIRSELDGRVDEFGDRLWELLKNQALVLKTMLNQEKDLLVSVSYSDRYINSPLPARLLVEAILALKNEPCADGWFFEINLLSREFIRQDTRPAVFIWNDWENNHVRDEVITKAFEYCGFTPKIESHSAIPHGRVMKLQFQSGNEIVIQLDQGFSYWRNDSRESNSRWFFDYDIAKQVEILVKHPISVSGDNVAETQIFVKSTN